jgi:tRNA(fMet)-specific endonuclease VapC
LILLDRNLVIHYLKGVEPATSRIKGANPAQVALPSVVVYELEYGTLKTASSKRRRIVETIIAALNHVPFDRDAARESARIRHDLEKRGQVLGPMDLMIAGTVLSRGATLVTNNTKEFSRVKGLRLEDWTR